MKRKIKIAAAVLVLLLLFGVMAFLGMEMLGKSAMLQKGDDAVEMMAPETEEVLVEEDGQIITYKGEKYIYNENITSVLCMGIDKYDSKKNEDKIVESGQADM